jgi:hypothetical protein
MRTSRNALISLALAAFLAPAGALPATAHEISSASFTPGLQIHSAQDVLERFCVEREGRLVLTLPGGASFELITSVDDPAISNSGDGRFHPFPEAEVRSALQSIRFPLEGIAAQVYILPFPRRSGLESAAGPGLILLSPGVRELSPPQVHAELAHELGHVVHHARMPDRDVEAWQRYRQLRGITDESVFHPWAEHANRPHEIFAEDFRALFGGELANYAGTIENPALAQPASVAGLRDFMLEIGAAASPALSFAYPNPTRGPARVVIGGAPAGGLAIFDVSGRQVRRVKDGLPQAGGVSYEWDGRAEDGSRVAAGAYLARAWDGAGPAVRIIVLPAR